jgi:hypothetical protein
VKEKKENQINTRHESRHSTRPNVFYFLPNPQFFKPILTSRTNGTFAFAPIQIASPSAKSKEPFLSQCSIYSIFE